ncbi:hypothetical protein GCM10009635_25610 [Actinocatenispora thailandica]
MHGQLSVQQQRARLDVEPGALAEQHDPAAAGGAADREGPAGGRAGAVHRHLAAGSPGQLGDRGVRLVDGHRPVDRAEFQRGGQPSCTDVDADPQRRAEGAAEQSDGLAHRPEADHQQPVRAGDGGPAQPLVRGAETARDAGTVHHGQ